jgi:hypothetical protein
VTRVKAARVRFYIDADILGLAKILASLRADITYPGDKGATLKHERRPPCPVTTPAAKDHEWLPVVAGLGWLVITRDRHIEEHRREIALVKEYGARLITLSGPDAVGTWQQLQVVMKQWSRIESAADDDGPFILRATATGDLRSVSLEPKRSSDRASASRKQRGRRPAAAGSATPQLPLDLHLDRD